MILRKLTSVVGLKNTDGDQVDPSTETTLQSVKTVLDNVLTALGNIDDNTDTLEVKAENINLNTDTLETKVQSVKDQLDVLLSSRASETTVSSIKSTLEIISAKISVDINTLSKEATLIQVRDYLDTVETKLQSLIDKNQAQETGGNLSAINTKTGEVQDAPTQYTILGRLKALWDKLQEMYSCLLLLCGIVDTYAAVTSGSTAGANKVHSNLFNSVGSGVLIKIHKIEVCKYTTALATGHNISFAALRSSTTGTGTTRTIAALDTNSPALPAGITIRDTFTVNPTTNGTLALGNLDTEESRTGIKCSIYESGLGRTPITLREGQGLAIQQQAYASGGSLSIIFYFTLG